ncbi:MAG: EAL domain-containing protein, partial [Clostridia bacterium]
DKEKLEVSSIEKGLKFIAEIAKRNEMKLKKSFAPKAYAERYPHNQQAVLRGKEEFAPIDNEFDDEEYDFIENELSCNIITRLMGEDFNLDEKQGQNKLDALRQQATTIKGAIAIAEPIVYFYDVALNNDNSIAYINVQQVLNDKFLGKILPVQYYSVAESSERITKLNLLAIKQVVKDCDDNPELSFAIKISCRLVARKDAFDKLIKAAQPKNDNLIMAFDCSLLELLGKDGENAINSLKQQGIKIMIDDTENASLRVLTEYPIDFLRFDSRYYNLDNPATLSHLDMLTGYAAVQAIVATSQYVNTTKEVDTMQKHGVMVIQGFAVNKPQRILNSAKKRIKLLKPFK